MAYLRPRRQAQPAHPRAPRRGLPRARYLVIASHRPGGHEALMRGRGIASAVALIAACSNEPAGVRPPAIDAAAVAASPSNVLSAAVAVGGPAPHTLRVRYCPEGCPLDHTTPAGFPLGNAGPGPPPRVLPHNPHAPPG